MFLKYSLTIFMHMFVCLLAVETKDYNSYINPHSTVGLQEWPRQISVCRYRLLLLINSQLYVLIPVKTVSILTGPPGTGKTYVGLKIMESLLYNLYGVSGCDDKRRRGGDGCKSAHTIYLHPAPCDEVFFVTLIILIL